MQRNQFPSSREDAFHGLPHCREHSIEYGSCKMIDKGCKYFHKGIDCIQQFRNHDCSGGCRYEHRKIINDDKYPSKSSDSDPRGNLKRKADDVGSDSRSARDERDRNPRDLYERDRDMRDRDPRDGGRDPRDSRDSRDPRDLRGDQRDLRDPRDGNRDPVRDTRNRDPRDVGREGARDRDLRDGRDAPRDARPEIRDLRAAAPRDPPRDMRDGGRDPRDSGRDIKDQREVLDRERESSSKTSSRDDPRQRDLERGDESKSKKIKLESDVDRLIAKNKPPSDLPPPRDDRYPPKRPFERDMPPARHQQQSMASQHDIYIPRGNVRADSFPPRDLGRDLRDPRDLRDAPRDFRDGRPYFPDEPQGRPSNKYNHDRPAPNFNSNFPPIDQRDRERGLPPSVDNRFRQEMLNRNRGLDRLPDRRFDGINERDRYVSDFPDDRNRAPMINDDPYRRRDQMDDLRGPPRADFNRAGMRMPNEMESEAARNMRLHRNNDPRGMPDFPRGNRDMPMMRDGPRDGPRMAPHDYEMGAGREMFALRFRERVEMKAGLERDSWQQPPARPDFLNRDHARGNTFNNLPHGDLRLNNNKQGMRPFDDRNMPIRGDYMGEPGRKPDFMQDRFQRDPARQNFGNGPVHPFASRVHSFAERNNMEPNSINDKRRELRNALPSANFPRNNPYDPIDRKMPMRNMDNHEHVNHRDWQQRPGDRGVEDANRNANNNSMIIELNQNNEPKKDVAMQSETEEKETNKEQEGEEERKEENPEAQRWNNVRQVLSKLNIYQSLVGNDLYDHITQIKKESCQVKEQANKKIIAERTLAAQIMKEATGADSAEEEFSSLKTDLSASGDLKGDKDRALNDEMDGEENMDYIENGERLYEEYMYNLQQIRNIPNISEVIFTQFCNPMKVGPT